MRNQVKKKAFEYFQSLQATHSKSKELKYSTLKLQTYLQPGTEKLTVQEKQFTFRARTRTIDLLGNFKTGKPPNCSHTFCSVTNSQTNYEIVSSPVNYDDLYSEDSKKVASVARVLKTKHELFRKIIKPSEPHTSSVSLQPLL